MSYWRLYYHLVWSTRDRLPLIDGVRRNQIERTIRAASREEGTLIHALNFMPDHVHLAVSIPPRIAVAAFVRRLKSASSYVDNHEDGNTDSGPFAWQSEYGVVSFGEASHDRVIAYIKNQADHHADDHLWATFEETARPFSPKSAGSG